MVAHVGGGLPDPLNFPILQVALSRFEILGLSHVLEGVVADGPSRRCESEHGPQDFVSVQSGASRPKRKFVEQGEDVCGGYLIDRRIAETGNEMKLIGAPDSLSLALNAVDKPAEIGLGELREPEAVVYLGRFPLGPFLGQGIYALVPLEKQFARALARLLGSPWPVGADRVPHLIASRALLDYIDAAAFWGDVDGEAGELGIPEEFLPAGRGSQRIDADFGDFAARHMSLRKVIIWQPAWSKHRGVSPCTRQELTLFFGGIPRKTTSGGNRQDE